MATCAGANAIYNVLEKGDVVMLAEGLDIFRTPVPADLVGRSLGGTSIRDETGCSVIAIEEDGRRVVNPPADMPIPGGPGAELILIGTTASERRFMERYASGGRSTRHR